jgi:hypothetical protein
MGPPQLDANAGTGLASTIAASAVKVCKQYRYLALRDFLQGTFQV